MLSRYHWVVHTVALLNLALLAVVVYQITVARFEGYTFRIFFILAIPLVGIVLLYRKPWIGRWIFISLLSFGLLGDLGRLSAQLQTSTLVSTALFFALVVLRCWLLWQLLFSQSFLAYVSSMRLKRPAA